MKQAYVVNPIILITHAKNKNTCIRRGRAKGNQIKYSSIKLESKVYSPSQ